MKIKKQYIFLLVILMTLIYFYNSNFRSSKAMEIELAGDNYRPTINGEYEFLEYGYSIMASNEEFLWSVSRDDNNKQSIFNISKDGGKSWEQLYKFEKEIEGVHLSKNGKLLLAVSNGRWLEDAQGEIYLSEDYGENFLKVLDLESGSATNWNFTSDDEGYIFVSEYGYKNFPNNSRKIYRSRNNGKDWEVVYDPEEEDDYHNHVIAIDKYDKNIIYQVVGDGNKHILRSKDRGLTWEKMIEGDYHPTALVQLEDKILWGLDNQPVSGIISFDKKSQEIDYAFKPPRPLYGSIYDMMYVDDVIYAGFLSYSTKDNHWDGSVFTSKDKGESWDLFIRWPKVNENSAIGFFDFFHQGDYGYINVKLPAYINGELDHYVGTLKFKLL